MPEEADVQFPRSMQEEVSLCEVYERGEFRHGVLLQN